MTRKKIFQITSMALASIVWLAANDWSGANFSQYALRTPSMYGEAGLTSFYKGAMEVNGETTQVEIFTAFGDLPLIAERFAMAAKEKTARSWFHVETTGAFGFAQQDDQLSRFVFAQVEPRQSLLYAVHQSYPPQVAGNRNVLPFDFPVYPGAVLDIAIHHRETGTRLVTYSAGGMSAIVLDYYQMTLVENGWKQLGRPLHDERTVEAAAQVAFRKGNQFCVVNCEPVPSTGEITIVVLMKDSIP